MGKAISAADANRSFSRVLRDVREGQSYIVTSHGRPVARIAPVGEKQDNGTDARALLLKRLRSEKEVTVARWKREDLYE